jgi:integrase
MQVKFPGYVPERRGDRLRHRVRVKGDKARRITIPVGPDHPEFSEHYHAARAGQTLQDRPKIRAPHMSLDALVQTYLDRLERDVAHKRADAKTLKQRRSLLSRICDMPDPEGARMGALHCDLPPAALSHIIDQWGAATSQADNSMKALRAAYREVPWLAHNPAQGVRKVHRARGGAKPWSIADLRAFMATHPPGTAAHIWLMLSLFTGARLSDLALLGRRHEVRHDGITWLEWQPGKRGSAPAAIPMAPPLFEALRATPVIGRTYILNREGQPFANGESLAERVRKWTAAAGLDRRSSHGIRKALGGLLAEAGATEHQIMAVLTHTKAETAEIYTRSAERRRMAASAMAAIGGLTL